MRRPRIGMPHPPAMRKSSAATILPPPRTGYVSLAESGFLYQRFRHPGLEYRNFAMKYQVDPWRLINLIYRNYDQVNCPEFFDDGFRNCVDFVLEPLWM